MRKEKQRRQAGHTLVEPLIAIVIAGLVFAAMVPLFVDVLRQGSADNMRNVALNLAQAKIERVRQLDYDSITAENLRSPSFAAGQFGEQWTTTLGSSTRTFAIDYSVTPEPAGANEGDEIYKIVTVTVVWTAPPAPVKPVVLRTVVYRQSGGPQIVNLTVSEVHDGLITQMPITLTARVGAEDLRTLDYVRFAVSQSNGSDVATQDVSEYSTDSYGAYFQWVWNDDTIGDGRYTFTAVAVSQTGQSGGAWPLTYTIDRGPPAPPSLSAAGVKAGSSVVSLTWGAPQPVASDLDHYEVWRRDSATGGESLLLADLLPSTITTYIDRAVANDTTYYYTVKAVDGNDWASNPSSEVPATPTAQTVDPNAPTQPGRLTATVDGQNVALSWQASSDGAGESGVAGYRVYRDDPGHVSPISVITAVPGLATYTYSDMQAGWSTQHRYEVTAFDVALNESTPAAQNVSIAAAPVGQAFSLTVQVTGQSAQVTVASLDTGQVYNAHGTPVTIKANSKGYTWTGLPYGTYRIITLFTTAYLQKVRDLELVRSETVVIPYP